MTLIVALVLFELLLLGKHHEETVNQYPSFSAFSINVWIGLELKFSDIKSWSKEIL